jgi:hypothetical protein
MKVFDIKNKKIVLNITIMGTRARRKTKTNT